MDGQVITEISNSETMRDIKKLDKIHPIWNIFLMKKYYLNFFVAAKLSAPRPFVFWTQNGCHLLNFAATKKFKNIFFTRKIFQLGSVFLSFCSGFTLFELFTKRRFLSSFSNPPVEGIQQKLSAGGMETKEKITFW